MRADLATAAAGDQAHDFSVEDLRERPVTQVLPASSYVVGRSRKSISFSEAAESALAKTARPWHIASRPAQLAPVVNAGQYRSRSRTFDVSEIREKSIRRPAESKLKCLR